MDYLKKAVAFAEKYTSDVPVVVISSYDGLASRIVLVYSDFDTSFSADREILAEKIQVVRLRESDVIKSLIRDGGKIASRYFHRPIVLKDELHIMPLILEYIQDDGMESRPDYGNLTVCFNQSGTPYSFFSNSLIPFLKVTKGYLAKADSFCLISLERSVVPSVCACWELPDHEFDYTGLMRHIAEMIPETNLHALQIDYRPVRYRRISPLQLWSTSRFLTVFGDAEDSDAVIREMFGQYLFIAQSMFERPMDFLRHNRILLSKVIPLSLSSLTGKVPANSLRGNVTAKVLQEYNSMLKKNLDVLFALLKDACTPWNNDSRVVPQALVPELDELERKHKEDVLPCIYRTLFSSSLLNAVHAAFFPYCINELLPIIHRL